MGTMTAGSLFIAVGVAILILEGVDAGMFAWIGIGLVLAGGSFYAGAWDDEQKRRYLLSPNIETLFLSVGFATLGTLLLLWKGEFNAGLITWIGLGLYLAGASTFSDVWSIKEDGDSDDDE
jgi:hypothetical protein